MNKKTLFTLIFVPMFILIWLYPSLADRCNLDDCLDYPVLWEHDNFKGKCLKLPVTRHGFKNYDFNDKASSVCVPEGWLVKLYEHTNCEGNYLSIYGPKKIADLKRDRPDGINWGDKISSAEVFELEE